MKKQFLDTEATTRILKKKHDEDASEDDIDVLSLQATDFTQQLVLLL
jgi:hypothetical protein